MGSQPEEYFQNSSFIQISVRQKIPEARLMSLDKSFLIVMLAVSVGLCFYQSFSAGVLFAAINILGYLRVSALNNTNLMRACEKGDLATTKKLIKKGVNIDDQDMVAVTALQRAMVKNQESCALLLIQAGADVNWVNAFNQSVLTLALLFASDKTIEELLAAGADVNIGIDRYGNSPLQIAVNMNRHEMVQRLIQSGAFLDACDNEGCSCVFSAVIAGNEKMLTLLLEAGANPHLPNQEGITPLSYARTSEQTGIIQIIENHNYKGS